MLTVLGEAGPEDDHTRLLDAARTPALDFVDMDDLGPQVTLVQLLLPPVGSEVVEDGLGLGGAVDLKPRPHADRHRDVPVVVRRPEGLLGIRRVDTEAEVVGRLDLRPVLGLEEELELSLGKGRERVPNVTLEDLLCGGWGGG